MAVTGKDDDKPTTSSDGTITWSSPEIVITGPSPLVEEQRIGDYEQPRWTARRLFPNTRIYVAPAGIINYEFWYTPKIDLSDPGNVRIRTQHEMEFGLGYRLQLDLYLELEQNGWGGALELHKQKIELRYALADWGEIWGNPALYFEYAQENGGGPSIEAKLLLGGELSSGWHAGMNLVYERSMSGEHEQEYALTAGISHVIVDRVFSAGAEIKLEAVDVEGSRLSPSSYEFLIGPSLRWFPVSKVHVDFVGLLGVEFEDLGSTTEDSWLFQPTLIVGSEL